MNKWIGVGLALAMLLAGGIFFGWQGVLLALTGVVFWLLMQFTRALRAMRAAGGAPVGRVASAVMLHAALKKGQRLMDVIQLTRSLGEKVADDPETYRWTDDSGASVRVELTAGRCTGWTLQRPSPDAGDGPPA